MDAMKADQHFDCHKTLDYSETDECDEQGEPLEAARTDRTAICAGFAVIAEMADRPTQMMRIAERLGMYDPKRLNLNAPVHKTAEDFVAAQPGRQRRRRC
jgi:hypothetical protein